MRTWASPSVEITRLLNVPVSLFAVVNVLDPTALPFHIALSVPLSDLYVTKASEDDIDVVVLYLLAAVVFKLAPAEIKPPVLSVKPEASLLVPWDDVVSESVLVLSPSGATGAFLRITLELVDAV